MKIKLQLLRKHISRMVEMRLHELDIDADKIADTRAIITLDQIHKIVCRREEISDSEMVEQIRQILRDNMLDIMEEKEY